MSFPNDGPSTAKARNQAGHRSRDAKGGRQSRRIPWFDRALSDRRRPARPPRRILCPSRLSGHTGAAGRADVAGRPANARRRPCAVGLAAIATTLLSVPSAGDHGLVTDNVYRPSRTRRPKPSRPRDLEARLHRRVRPVRHRVEAGAAEGGRRPARYRQAVRHGPFVGRLRKPQHPVRLRSLPHRDQMVPRRADAAARQNVDDLKADLDCGFAALKAAA
jgi:hypothetical protein